MGRLRSSVEAFKDDEEVKKFLGDAVTKKAVEETLVLSEVNDADYAAIFYVGGHGPCFVSRSRARREELELIPCSQDLAVDPVSIALAEKVRLPCTCS